MCVREMNFHSVDDIEEAVTGSLVSGLGVLVWFGLVWVKTQKGESGGRSQKREKMDGAMRNAKNSNVTTPKPRTRTLHPTPHYTCATGRWLFIYFLLI